MRLIAVTARFLVLTAIALPLALVGRVLVMAGLGVTAVAEWILENA